MLTFANKRVQKGKQNNVSILETTHSGAAIRWVEYIENYTEPGIV